MENNNTEREFVMLTDEDGNESEWEFVAYCEMEGTTYYALMPANEEIDVDEGIGYIVLKSVINGESEDLISIDDDEEFDRVADYFDDLFASQVDYDQD